MLAGEPAGGGGDLEELDRPADRDGPPRRGGDGEARVDAADACVDDPAPEEDADVLPIEEETGAFQDGAGSEAEGCTKEAKGGRGEAGDDPRGSARRGCRVHLTGTGMGVRRFAY